MRTRVKSTVAVVFALILLCGVPLTVLASDSNAIEQYRYATQQYQTYKDKYVAAKQLYIDARQKFQDARAKYQQAKNNETTRVLKEAAQAYMIKAIDYAISYLGIVKYNVGLAESEGIVPFKASDNLQQYINELEQKKVEVQNAATARDLINVAKSVQTKWQNIRAEVKYYFGYILKNRIELFLNKAHELANRLDKEIQALKARGIQTTGLETGLAKFNNWLSQADTAFDKAKQAYATHGGIDTYGHVTNLAEANKFLVEANSYLVDAHRYLKNAASELRELYKEYKNVKGAILVGTGKLEASGNGTAIIEGSGTVTVSGTGTLTITDKDGNTSKTVSGFGLKNQSGSVTAYEGTGSATITGTKFKVELQGTGITLTAEGTGIAILKGTGTYTAKKGTSTSTGSLSATDISVEYGGSS